MTTATIIPSWDSTLDNRGCSFHCDVEIDKNCDDAEKTIRSVCSRMNRCSSCYGMGSPGGESFVHITWSFATEAERDAFIQKGKTLGFDMHPFYDFRPSH